MTHYEYLCHQRPPVPGAIPRTGLVSVIEPPEGISTVTVDSKTYNCWGYAVYDRPLTTKELADYELIFLATRYVL